MALNAVCQALELKCIHMSTHVYLYLPAYGFSIDVFVYE